MNMLISGSVAYDFIMSFPGTFKDHILPDKIHILNVSFVVDKLERNYGGVATNIAYTTAVLGGKPIVLGTFGNDGEEYKTYLEEKGAVMKYASVAKEDTTSAAFITTDQDDNQITAFYPGIARSESPFPIKDVEESTELILISPTRVDIMLEHARGAAEKNIPIVLDLGQRLTDHTKESIRELISLSSFFISNDYELQLAVDKSGLSEKEILETVGVVVTTLGKEGSRISTEGGEVVMVPTGVPKTLVDPTGAGDAYRAGFFTAHLKGLDLETCARVGSVAALFAVEFHGTQNPELSLDAFRARFSEVYKENAPL